MVFFIVLFNFCMGIVKYENVELFEGEKGDWVYFVIWGQQSLVDDYLGMVIFYCKVDDVNIIVDEYSYVVVFNMERIVFIYYFLVVWEQEFSGF